MNEPVAASLEILAILDDAGTTELMLRTLAESGDRLGVATDLAEGLARTAAESPDVVFVDVALGRNAGLAVVHHLRAVAPSVVVYALSTPDRIELGTQAVALGGAGLLMLPLSGDELLTALGSVRERRAEREIRLRLEREAQRSQRGESLVSRVAELCEAKTRREAAERLISLLVSETGASAVAVYLPVGERARQLMRSAVYGAIDDAPTFCDEMTALGYARSRDFDAVPLTLKAESSGLLVIAGARRAGDQEALPLVGLVAMQAATALALIGEREQSTRGAIKDPTSSAYTFAYFVDVAGREIDKARRHGRHFALATLSVEPAAPGTVAPPVTQDGPESLAAERSRRGRSPSTAPRAAGVEVADRVLDAVRDTDVLARVDEQEFYLLMPETGGAGAHTCRRRVLRRMRGAGARGATHLDATMGVATFPHDGGDLSQLLRVAKHRAEASKRSAVRKLELERLPLGEILDTLLWTAAEASGDDFDAPRLIELPAMDLVGLALSAVNEARRSGKARVVAAQRPGVSASAAIRAIVAQDSDDLVFDALDVTAVPGFRDLELLGIVSEHASYVLLGRSDRGVVRAVHSSDTLLVDLVILRLGEVVGQRLLD